MEITDKTDSPPKLGKAPSHNGLVAIFAITALATLLIPLQHYVTLGRYQHYGLAIAIFGLGYVLQSIWSWKRLSKWARLSYLITGIFCVFVGDTFYANPWLDVRMSMRTQRQELFHYALIVLYLIGSLAIVATWVKWIREESRSKK